MQTNKYVYVVFLATSATMFGALMASSVKFLTMDLHPIIICFYRCLMGLIFISPWMIKNNFKALKSNNLKLFDFSALKLFFIINGLIKINPIKHR